MKTKQTIEQRAIKALEKLSASEYKCRRLAGTMRRYAASLPPGFSAILVWQPDTPGAGFSVQCERLYGQGYEVIHLGSVDSSIDTDSISTAASDLADRLANPAAYKDSD